MHGNMFRKIKLNFFKSKKMEKNLKHKGQKIQIVNDQNEIEYCLFHSVKNSKQINVVFLKNLNEKTEIHIINKNKIKHYA